MVKLGVLVIVDRDYGKKPHWNNFWDSKPHGNNFWVSFKEKIILNYDIILAP